MSACLIYPDDGFIQKLCRVYSQLQWTLHVGQRYVKVSKWALEYLQSFVSALGVIFRVRC